MISKHILLINFLNMPEHFFWAQLNGFIQFFKNQFSMSRKIFVYIEQFFKYIFLFKHS